MRPDAEGSIAKHWNYNVSHHGNFVCIGAHSNLLVSELDGIDLAIAPLKNRQIGVDLVDLSTRQSFSSVNDFIAVFKEHLTAVEFAYIHR